MKKFFIALSVILLLVILYLGYKLKQVSDNILMPIAGDHETISQLENELSLKTQELSGLQSENQLLKNTLSGTMDLLNSLQLEKSGVEKDLSGCEIRLEKYIEYIEKLVEENSSNAGNNTATNNSSSNSNATTTNSKEVGIIKQIYNDANGNRKLEIDYVQLRGYGENGCEYPLCIVNENPKLRTFTVSDNVEIIMKTLDYTKPTTISYDYLYQIFNTDNYSEYKYLKDIPFRITIENNVVTKIEEQFLS